MEYRCPRDGFVLHVVDAVMWDAHTAPLLCDVCLQHFWLVELKPEALLTYNQAHRTHRTPTRIASQREHAEAVLRGHGVSDEVYALFSTRQLEAWKARQHA